MKRLKPAAANLRAMALPMPRVEPVINAFTKDVLL